MALLDDNGELRKLVAPAVATIAGAGAGLLLTRKPIREAIPDLGDRGIGDLADDLRGKLDSVLGKASSSTPASGTGSARPQRLDGDQLRKRRNAREQRRRQRRART